MTLSSISLTAGWTRFAGRASRQWAGAAAYLLAARSLVLAVLLSLPAALLLLPAVAAATGDTILTYDLQSDIQARVDNDGVVRIVLIDGAGEVELLQAVLPLPPLRRQAQDHDVIFSAVFGEGAPGGHRGFARDADDDVDGRLDEDRVDGRDNDGDDHIDEDFAAISEAMAVLDRTRSGRRLHLETYHWSYPHLRGTVLLSCRHEDLAGEGRDTVMVLTAPGGDWRRVEFSWRVHGAIGGEASHLARLFAVGVRHPYDHERLIWLGITPLPGPAPDQVPVTANTMLPRLENAQLEMPLAAGVANLALSVAPTFLQLRCNLAAALAVHHGVRDLANRRQVAWIVPPLCPVCREGKVPPARWERDQDGWRLVFAVSPGQNALFDPDRLTVDGALLGRPAAIEWTGSGSNANAAAENWTLNWAPAGSVSFAGRADLEPDPAPFLTCDALWQHAGAGELSFRFAGPPPVPEASPDGSGPSGPSEASVLSGVLLTGQVFRQELPAPPALPAVVDAASGEYLDDPGAKILRTLLRQDGQPPTLSPELLDNYPNPFRDQTRIRYRIPETIEEGLVWADESAPEVDPASPMPYRSSQPTVSLKVYSIGGQEIATLYAGSLGAGQHEEVWDGTDASGRPVASGTYFCKLQIENWTVTKRLVFLR